MIEFSIVNRPVRVRFEKIGSAASHIENYFMCQDLRMEFTAIEIEGLKKKGKVLFGGMLWSSVFRVLHFSKLKSNAKHETPGF
jgi:hypothetical protein